MSRYAVNAVLRRVNLEPAELADYRADPVRYVSARRTEGPPLTDQEAAALAEADFTALYSMGAHPYLMWGFVEAVWVPDRLDRASLVEQFRTAVRGITPPDIRTTPTR